jgi:DNA-binding NtrC family response regulator
VPTKKIDKDAVEALQARNWTGNIRELRNVVERLIIMSNKTITKQDIIDFSGPNSKANNKGIDFDNFANLQQLQDYNERSFIEYHLDKNQWNTSKTAEFIGINKKELEEKMENLGLKKR